ncbi:hypothetical protein CRUP_035303 [Coryphaenoides rupestris]|nr:hypothetical protein CRUP_035303 [Coryphaenoides rupestris]
MSLCYDAAQGDYPTIPWHFIFTTMGQAKAGFSWCQLAVGTCEVVLLNRDSSVPRRTVARQTARCACRRGQIAGTTRARPACVDGQLAVGTCEVVLLNRDSSVPRRTVARQTARCACRRGQIAGTTRARPACVDARIVRSRQWCEMVPCVEGEVCGLLLNRSGWTCTRGSGRIKTVTGEEEEEEEEEDEEGGGEGGRKGRGGEVDVSLAAPLLGDVICVADRYSKASGSTAPEHSGANRSPDPRWEAGEGTIAQGAIVGERRRRREEKEREGGGGEGRSQKIGNTI